MKNYLTYPVKTMNITQGYAGSYSHAPHINGSPADYPIDEAGADGGRDWFYCPCDEMKIANIYGVNKAGTNTIWIESTSKVVMPYGEDFVTILVTHPNDDDLSKLKAGQVFKRGDAMFREGTDGNATGNHFHMAVGTGKFTGSGWVKNTKSAWVHKTTGVQLKPEQAFYVDKTFTTIKSSKNVTFINKPADEVVIDKYYKVTVDSLNVRKGPGTSYGSVTQYQKDKMFHATLKSGSWVYSEGTGWCTTDYLTEVVLGDVNQDGKVGSDDSRTILRASVGLENLNELQKDIADINRDGKVDSADAREALRRSVGLE